MIKHVFKIIRAQFRSNMWILAELMVVFVALWVMTDYFIRQYTLYRQPVGFDTDRVYNVSLSRRPADSPQFINYPEGSEEPERNLERIAERIRQHPDVEAVCLSSNSLPYTVSKITWQLRRDSILHEIRQFQVSPDYFRVFGITPAAGGSPDELAQRIVNPGLVISADMAEAFFGRTNVVGEELVCEQDTMKIVAVTEPVRNDEYNREFNYAWFELLDRTRSEILNEETCMYTEITFRIRPNVEKAGFEERFMKEMRLNLQAGNFWVSDVECYNDIRDIYMERNSNSNGQQIISSVMLFLLVNVFLAVIGSFWFRVSRRKEELGLRMAMGSTRSGLMLYIVTESLLLLLIASLPAMLICANIVYADVIPVSSAESPLLRFIVVSVITWLALAVIIVLGVWYPAYRASKVAPSEALKDE